MELFELGQVVRRFSQLIEMKRMFVEVLDKRFDLFLGYLEEIYLDYLYF